MPKNNEIANIDAGPKLPANPITNRKAADLRAVLQKEQARAALKQDVNNWIDSGVEQHVSLLLVAWDITNIAASDEDSVVEAVLAEILAEAKASGKAKQKRGMSVANIYKKKSIIQNIIASKAGMPNSVTIPYMKRHQNLLLLLTRDEVKKIAETYSTMPALEAAYPKLPCRKISKGAQPLMNPIPPLKTLSIPNVIAKKANDVLSKGHPLEMPEATMENLKALIQQIHIPLVVATFLMTNMGRMRQQLPEEMRWLLPFFAEANKQGQAQTKKLLKLGKTQSITPLLKGFRKACQNENS